ncbi:[protein-PII] uridylyltransferase [Stappia taiwanensis]|uniref:Bifunctional uridylyltransferase/uridylyl-removing enzyme n=1 Tax=Stappia taiwanensis TaxID=992267 RepID=A0A838XTP1_9HYPH|nr:[protein-PII] uridylyltransferase [Stappia taiwanensis]MBA4611906.1 [protein-PII] uridylyltransferase [Stappia taiwanensis]GGF03697.1 bifunctional uridylyltransferase/uridylyl-removing enzyme [Stappia taiwanensis]
MSKTADPLAGLIDSQELRRQLTALTVPYDGDGSDMRVRAEALSLLKAAMRQAREVAEKRLFEDGGGTLCARRLSHVQDEVIRVIYDYALHHVYRVKNPSAAERMAVVAVGGYGRGTLAPGSDVDLLFLLPYKQTPWGEQVVEYILYMLWDLGLKVGHATRNVEECLRLSRSDMTIRTAVLEARFIWGDKALFADMVRRFDTEVVAGSGPEFIAAKLAERDERHRRQGTSRYLVEPNVKEGKGGLRDLNTLFWISKYFYRVRSGAGLIKAGVFSRADYQRFKKGEDFLWAVRCHLHFLTGRAEERLSFDVQREIAVRLGYTQHPGMKDVERFMKHYFLVAKDVGDLTRIFCAALEEQHAKAPQPLSRLIGQLTGRNRRRRLVKGFPEFVIDNGRLNLASESAFEKDPVNLIRLFALAERHSAMLHPEMLKRVRRSLKLIGPKMREDPEANRLFLQVLTSRSDPETLLRKMNETGVLGRFLPDFGKVVAMMQFSMYHHYTVDEHLIRSIGVLGEIERGEAGDDHPLATDLIRTIQNRKVLFVAMLLHDIAKGRPEDHSIAGARIARRLCRRLGLSASETDTVAWLVEHHLDMSTIAQSRDLSDRKTIEDFARVVQSLERLKLLLIFTVADIRAVGPNVFNGWKGQLLRTLYYETEPLLSGGHSQAPHSQRVAAAKAELAEALASWEPEAREAYLERHYPAYWLRVPLERKLADAQMIREADAAATGFASRVVAHAFEEVTEITVLAADHPKLLSTIAGACFVAGANIVDAQIDTTTDGYALDTIFISRELPRDDDELRRGERICTLIEKALRGQERLPDSVARKAAARGRMKAFRIEAEVLVNNSWSNRHTVLEVSGLDRPGLLFDLTRAISGLNLNINSAHIATFGERVVDVFYVTDLTGQKIGNIGRQEAIRTRLCEAVDGEEGEEPGRRRPRRTSAV